MRAFTAGEEDSNKCEYSIGCELSRCENEGGKSRSFGYFFRCSSSCCFFVFMDSLYVLVYLRECITNACWVLHTVLEVADQFPLSRQEVIVRLVIYYDPS